VATISRTGTGQDLADPLATIGSEHPGRPVGDQYCHLFGPAAADQHRCLAGDVGAVAERRAGWSCASPGGQAEG
jgi:hypothetical protein